MKNTPLLASATQFLLQEKRFSIALLQRKFRLGFSEALKLKDELSQAHVIEEPNPHGHFHISRHLLSDSIKKKDSIYIHALVLRNLALYLIEHRGFESTKCLELLTQPYPYERNHQALRSLAKACIAESSEPLSTLALQLSETPSMANKIAPSLTKELLLQLCQEICIDIPDRSDSYAMRLSGLKHAMLYLHRRQLENIGSSSRTFETFIHDDLLTLIKAQNVSEETPIHREHVVPCALLRDKAIELLRHGISSDEVALWIEPFIRIVLIQKSDAYKLDHTLKLKYSMPEGWTFGAGCIYERLHKGDIPFTVSTSDIQCNCRATH